MFHDPKQLAKMGFEPGIGYVPLAGIGWHALRTIMKDRSEGSPVLRFHRPKHGPSGATWLAHGSALLGCGGVFLLRCFRT